ncbi:hypothetical protein [Williamwhitmania taraxaci]|uniref:Tissue inhibitor of metalloproteinase n=1 Tax=Williamwhitmania taraxaci TaxID=1640674 RepID=A0A1G6NWC6_9BACT|nr:hypothetical protein [Williamwhitmania taraxaci]SDC71557.1 hypothetical protein SAMN05216323_10461 [Williamwhitmania taraxaci]
MRNYLHTLKAVALLFLLLNTSTVFSQNCKPTIVSEDGNTEYFGGKVRDAIGLLTDDKSAYTFYVVQVNKGKDGTVAFVSFFEPVKDRDAYNKAINDYLTEEKLKTSFLEIQVDNKIIRIPSTNCLLEPKKTLGEIYGYTVSIQGDIVKEQVLLLQNSDIQKFKIVIGGKPYERTFDKPTKITQTIMKAVSCVNLDNMFEVKKKKPSELNLNEVEPSNYSVEIIGKWLSQSTNVTVLEFIGDKLRVIQRGIVVSDGNYKISGTRLIYTGATSSGASNNGVSNFELFLKDMITLKDKGQEITYERIE